MKVTVTDACVFIDLMDIGLEGLFFQLGLEVHTPLEVYAELFEIQQKVLDVHVNAGRLFVFRATSLDRIVMSNIEYPRGLSHADRCALYLAEKLNATLLSSDKKVRTSAKSKGIEYHGILWIMDQLVQRNLLTSGSACTKLLQLQSTNQMFRMSKELLEEVDKRIKAWSE